MKTERRPISGVKELMERVSLLRLRVQDIYFERELDEAGRIQYEYVVISFGEGCTLKVECSDEASELVVNIDVLNPSSGIQRITATDFSGFTRDGFYEWKEVTDGDNDA